MTSISTPFMPGILARPAKRKTASLHGKVSRKIAACTYFLKPMAVLIALLLVVQGSFGQCAPNGTPNINGGALGSTSNVLAYMPSGAYSISGTVTYFSQNAYPAAGEITTIYINSGATLSFTHSNPTFGSGSTSSSGALTIIICEGGTLQQDYQSSNARQIIFNKNFTLTAGRKSNVLFPRATVQYSTGTNITLGDFAYWQSAVVTWGSGTSVKIHDGTVFELCENGPMTHGTFNPGGGISNFLNVGDNSPNVLSYLITRPPASGSGQMNGSSTNTDMIADANQLKWLDYQTMPFAASFSDNAILCQPGATGTGTCDDAEQALVPGIATGGCGGGRTLRDELAKITVSGFVFNDVNGMSNSLVDGAVTNAGGTVFVSLVNPATNLVVSSVAVDAQGKYSLTIAENTSYNVILTNSLLGAGTSLTSSPFATATGSGGYVSTGEGTIPASDMNPNGIIVIPAGTTSFAAANFGIEQPPTAYPAADNFTDPGGTGTIQVPTLTGFDPEQGPLPGTGNLDTIIINTIPATGTLYYAGNPITTNGFRINNYNPALLTYDPPTGGGVFTFTFREVDAAEKTSAPATVTMTVAPSIVPDLTPIIRLVQNNFSASGVSRDLAVELQELRDRRTEYGVVEFSITVPVGFTIAFNSAITSITISGGATVAVQNGEWTLTDATQLGGRKLVFKANAATRILGLQKAVIGFSVTRTTSQGDTSPVISVSITDDATGDYDNNTLNNIFNRIINSL